MGDNKRLLTIAIALLILMNAVSLFRLGNMKRDIETAIGNLNSQISYLDSKINNQSSQISQTLNKFQEEQKWVGSSSYRLTSYDDTQKLVGVQVNWSFREMTPNSKVSLAYGEMSMDSSVQGWQSVKASASDNLNYSAELKLSPEKNYKLKVQGESADLSKGEELMEIALTSMIKDRVSMLPGIHGSEGPRYEHHAYVVNRFDNAEFLRLKSATAKVYVKDKLENTIELHRAAESELTKEIILKFSDKTQSSSNFEVWSNDEAIWVKGEENWVKTGENTWTNNGKSPTYGFHEVRIEVTAVDNMGVTYNLNFPPQ